MFTSFIQRTCARITTRNLRSSLPVNYSQKLSFVRRAKILQNMKEKNIGVDAKTIRENGEFLVYLKNRALLTQDWSHISWIPGQDLNFDPNTLYKNSILLGLSDEGKPKLAIQCAGLEPFMDEDALKSAGKFADPRAALMTLPPSEAALTSRASALLNWHRHHQFCSYCGNKTIKNPSGSRRTCSSCGEVSYPSPSPVAIVLVSNWARTHLLLVRQPRHPKGMYSCIAGFVDAGESIEDTVKREVAEEVGLTVENIEYQASQHWAAPVSNFMVGCHAVATKDNSQEIDMDREELQDARWFTVDQVKEALHVVNSNSMARLLKNEESRVFVPPRGAIANALITEWLERYG